MKFTKIRAPDFDLEKTLRFRAGVSLAKGRGRVCGSDWGSACLSRATRRIFKSSFWRDAKTSTRAACAPRNCQALLRVRSSAGGDLRFVSEGPGDECCPRFLSRVTDHSAAKVGMSGHIHLFVDETGGAYSPDFAGAPETIWRTTKDRRSARVHVRFAAASCASFGEGVARLQARLSRQKSACDGAARQLRPSGSRGVVGVV